MGISGPYNGGTVPYKAIFCGDIPLHRPYIGLVYGRYLQFRFLKWPLTRISIKHVTWGQPWQQLAKQRLAAMKNKGHYKTDYIIGVIFPLFA